MIRNRRKQRNENIEINAITKKTWETHFRAIYELQVADNGDSARNNNTGVEENTVITKEEVKAAIRKLKNRKTLGSRLNNE